MEIEGVSEFAMRHAESHVSDVLYKLRAAYTCRTRWVKPASSQWRREQTLDAAPLDNGPWLPHVLVEAHAETALGEYTAHTSSHGGGTMYREATGRVRLGASTSLALSVPVGATKYLSVDGSMPGFLCWAERHVLTDGSTAFRLRLNEGILWLRPQQKVGDALLYLLDKHEPPSQSPAEVVNIANCEWYVPQRCTYLYDGPWTGYETRDTAGRVWRIEKSDLNFFVDLRHKGRFNDRLSEMPSTVLMPPYEAMWRDPHEKEVGLSLTLDVKK